MPKAFPNASRSTPGSWLANLLDRLQLHPDSFVCGVRVVAGTVPGQSGRWRYRGSWVDPLILDGVVVFNHGTKQTLRLRIDSSEPSDYDGPQPRDGMSVISATLVDGSTKILIATPSEKRSYFSSAERY